MHTVLVTERTGGGDTVLIYANRHCSKVTDSASKKHALFQGPGLIF